MPLRDETARAHAVCEHAKSSVENFFHIFDNLAAARGRGAPADEEQDLLRAALVFAAAGLDSTLKELIKGTVKPLAAIHADVRQEFETFVQRQLKGESEDSESPSGYKFLASILSSSNPQSRLLDDYVYYLTGASLQSVDQLFKTVKALGIDPRLISDRRPQLASIFNSRNAIIHELDIKFTNRRGHRQRNPRRREDLRQDCNTIIELTDAIITAVEEKFPNAT